MLESILDIVCSFYGLSVAEVTSKGRRRPVASARQIVVFLAREQGMTTKEIGALVRSDHTYCSYCVKVVRERMEVYEDFRADVARLREALADIEEREAC